MSAVAFDTLKLARKLRDSAHMTQEQAEGVADALAEAMSGAELATKSDLRELEQATKADIAAVKADLHGLELKMLGRFDAADERLERRAAEIEGRLIKWVLGTGTAAILTIVGAAWAIISRLPTH